jgi:Na+/melibiose symporter-like transporter
MTIFAFLQTSCALSIEGATFYFFTDNATQYPEGPHFSAFFYTTVVGLVAGVFGLLGLWSYNRFMKDWTYRSIYFFANMAVTVLNLVGLLLYTRTNLKLGIPDKVFVICGSVVQSLVLTWMWIPGVVMLAHLCPRGLEASMYALLAGCHNIGSSVAQYSGAFMLNELGITPNGSPNESAVFANMWIAVVISACLPLLSLSLLPLCIPAKTQTAKILTEYPHSATVGSPWESVKRALGWKVEDPNQSPMGSDSEGEKDILDVEPEQAGMEHARGGSNTPEESAPLLREEGNP